MFSVGSEKEAKCLLTLCCQTNIHGEFIARELAEEQTLENLEAFSDRLVEGHELLVKNGSCDCKGALPKYSCYHCKKEVDKEYFCYGCKQRICDDCEEWESVATRTMGPHDPMDHKTKFEDGDF